MDGFERRKEQNRENIIRATETLVNRHGMNRVSISDIARQAGVSQVTIYNLFGSKDRLIQEAVEMIINRYLDHFREIIRGKGPYLGKLEAFVRYLLESGLSQPGFSEVVNWNDFPLKERIVQLTEEFRRMFVGFIREGQEQGCLNPELSEDAIGAHLTLMIQGIMASPDIHARTHYDRKFLQDIIMIMLYGFSKVK